MVEEGGSDCLFQIIKKLKFRRESSAASQNDAILKFINRPASDEEHNNHDEDSSSNNEEKNFSMEESWRKKVYRAITKAKMTMMKDNLMLTSSNVSIVRITLCDDGPPVIVQTDNDETGISRFDNSASAVGFDLNTRLHRPGLVESTFCAHMRSE